MIQMHVGKQEHVRLDVKQRFIHRHTSALGRVRFAHRIGKVGVDQQSQPLRTDEQARLTDPCDLHGAPSLVACVC